MLFICDDDNNDYDEAVPSRVGTFDPGASYSSACPLQQNGLFTSLSNSSGVHKLTRGL